MAVNITPGGQADLWEGQAVWVTNPQSNYYRRIGVIMAVHESRPGVWITFGRMARRYLALDEFSVFEGGACIRKGDPEFARSSEGQPSNGQSEGKEIPGGSIPPQYDRFRAVIRIREEGGMAEIYRKGGPVTVLRQPYDLLYWKIQEDEGRMTVEQTTGIKQPLSEEEVQQEYQKAIILVKDLNSVPAVQDPSEGVGENA